MNNKALIFLALFSFFQIIFSQEFLPIQKEWDEEPQADNNVWDQPSNDNKENFEDIFGEDWGTSEEEMNLETELSPIEEEFGFGEEHNFEHYENTEQGEHDYLVTDDLFSLDYRLPSDEFDDGLKFGRGDGYENDYEYGTRGETINEYELNEEGLYGEYSEEVAGEFLNEEQSHGSEWMEEMYEEVFGGLLL